MEVPGAKYDPASVSVDPFDRIIGGSHAAEAIRAFGRRAASVDAPVLLLGESGTGKGVLARAIHDASMRARSAFVPVNCAAVPEALFESEFFGHVRGAFTGAQYAHKGLFEQADRGTLFLDEIGELPPVAQAKLLTAIEDRAIRRVGGERLATFNVRIIAATAADLQQCVAQRTFRRDLFHRLRVLHFTIPPLRARHGDIAVLAQLFLDRYAATYNKGGLRLGEQARAFLDRCTWPGNVRELAHAIECAVVACDGPTIRRATLDAVPACPEDSARMPRTAPVRARYSFHGSASEEMSQIAEAIELCRGNKSRAAEMLGMSRNTLLNKLRSQGPSILTPKRKEAS